LLNTAMRPVQFAYNGVAEPKIQAVLADLLLDPSKAQAALLAARTAPQKLSPEVRAALPYLEQAIKASVPAAALTGQR
jgi:alkylhydroperoxidase family enzyme